MFRGILASVTAVALAATGLVTAPAPAAQASSSSTHSYIVLARTPGQTSAAQAAALKAGAQLVQGWPQIGVIVVRSARSGYLTSLAAAHNPAVLMAGDARKGTATDKVLLGKSVSVASSSRRLSAASSTVGGGSDPLTAAQGYLGADRALAAQRITAGSRDVVVGVLDNGVDDTHPDLAKNFSTADSVDCTTGGRPNTAAGAWRGSEGHGTHVASTIAAAHNGVGIVGVAPNVRVASVKVVDAHDATYPEYLVCGYMWAAQHRLTVTNASINVNDLWCGQLGLSGAPLVAVTRALAYATGRGVINVQSVGNDGQDISRQHSGVCYDPMAINPLVVHVASVNDKGRLSSFSNWGRSMVTIAAPGENVVADGPAKGYQARTGSSQAAPQVAGTLALMASRRPTWSQARIVATMLTHTKAVAVKSIGSRCVGTPRANACTGAGQLDTLAALKAM